MVASSALVSVIVDLDISADDDMDGRSDKDNVVGGYIGIVIPSRGSPLPPPLPAQGG